MGVSRHSDKEAPRWVWAAGRDLTARFGSPWLPCRKEARGEKPSRLHLSGQVVAAVSGAPLTRAPCRRAEQADLGAPPSSHSSRLHGSPQLQGKVGAPIPSVLPSYL